MRGGRTRRPRSSVRSLYPEAGPTADRERHRVASGRALPLEAQVARLVDVVQRAAGRIEGDPPVLGDLHRPEDANERPHRGARARRERPGRVQGRPRPDDRGKRPEAALVQQRHGIGARGPRLAEHLREDLRRKIGHVAAGDQRPVRRRPPEPRRDAGERPAAGDRIPRHDDAETRAGDPARVRPARSPRRPRRTPPPSGGRRDAAAGSREAERRACRSRSASIARRRAPDRWRRRPGWPTGSTRAHPSHRSSRRGLRLCTYWNPKRPLTQRCPVGDGVVRGRGDLHDLVVLDVELELAADAAVRADRVRDLLLLLVPGAGGAHLVLGREHERAGGTHADAVAAVDAGASRRAAPRTRWRCGRRSRGRPRRSRTCSARPSPQASTHL